MGTKFDNKKVDKRLKEITKNIDLAKIELRKIPRENWENFDFLHDHELDGMNRLYWSLAQNNVLYEYRKKEREEKLAAKWEEPAMVVAEKEFADATDFLLKLHPEAQQAAIDILASNIEEGRKSQPGGES